MFKSRQPTSLLLASGLVDNGRVLQASQVKHANTSILTTANKYVYALSAEPHIVDLLIVGNELSLCGERGNIPDSTCRIYARRNNETRGDGVPIE
jgi:hypothetical protein